MLNELGLASHAEHREALGENNIHTLGIQPLLKSIKLGIDAHAKYDRVSRKVDGATPCAALLRATES